MHMHVSMYTHAYNDDERTMTMTNDSVCLPLPRGEDARTGISYATRKAYAVFQPRLIEVVLTAEFLISAVSRQPLLQRDLLTVSFPTPLSATSTALLHVHVYVHVYVYVYVYVHMHVHVHVHV